MTKKKKKKKKKKNCSSVVKGWGFFSVRMKLSTSGTIRKYGKSGFTSKI